MVNRRFRLLRSHYDRSKSSGFFDPNSVTYDVFPSVVCGASGIRLLPVCRVEFTLHRSAILELFLASQITLQRFEGNVWLSLPYVNALKETRFLEANNVRQIGSVIDSEIEPHDWDTLMMVTLVVLLTACHGPDAVALIVLSDHHMPHTQVFQRPVENPPVRKHWVVVCSTAEVPSNDETLIVRVNESIHLQQRCDHCIANSGKFQVDFIEVQATACLEEDDINQIDDDFSCVLTSC